MFRLQVLRVETSFVPYTFGWNVSKLIRQSQEKTCFENIIYTVRKKNCTPKGVSIFPAGIEISTECILLILMGKFEETFFLI